MGNEIRQDIAEIGRAGQGSARDSGLRPEAVLVRDALLARGLETPMAPNNLSAAEKRPALKRISWTS
jgi:hypothetical protein